MNNLKPSDIARSDTFDDKLKKFVINHADESLLSFDEFKRIVKDWYTIKPLEHWYEIYKDLKYNSPVYTSETTPAVDLNDFINKTGFKSVKKIHSIINKQHPELNIDLEDIRNHLNYEKNYFPLKQNKKRYQLKTVAARNTYQIDFMFSDKYVYLIAINVNTRKAFAEPTSVVITKSGQVRNKNKDNKNSISYLNSLQKMIDKGMSVKYLIGDGEKAFNSKMSNDYYVNNNIVFRPIPLRNHSSLSIIDRFIRTLRDMAYNLDLNVIDYQTMNYLIDNYNTAPHSHLSKYLGFDCSPNMVTNDMEDFITEVLLRENYNIQHKYNYNVPIGSKVKIYNPPDMNKLNKRRTKVREGTYKITSQNGALFEAINNDGTKIIIPRWMIKLN